MREAIYRTAAYGMGAFAVLIASQMILASYSPGFKSSLLNSVVGAAIAAPLLMIGAFIAFVVVRKRVATSTEAAILGGISAVPATIVGVVLVTSLGFVGAAVVSIAVAGVIAALGGGALRRNGAHV
jgi:hypothetical protein